MKRKPNYLPDGTLSKTRLASCSGGILAGSTAEYWRTAPARYWPDTRQDPPARDSQRDTWRDLLVSYSGILSGILGGIHWRAGLVGYSAGSSYSGGILGGELLCCILSRILGGIHWQAALVGYSAGSTHELLPGYSAGSTGELLWDTQRDARPLAGGWDTRRDPLASYSGILSGGLVGQPLWRDTRRDPLASRSGGILTGKQLWRDTGRDPLASCRGILGGIHSQATLAGYSAGSTGELLWEYSAGSTGGLLWWDTLRDPLASRSGGILWPPACSGGILCGGVV